jgi:hypothetical protein
MRKMHAEMACVNAPLLMNSLPNRYVEVSLPEINPLHSAWTQIRSSIGREKFFFCSWTHPNEFERILNRLFAES